MKRLVITADDFGVSAAVNDAVERACRQGVLRAASLMVAGDAADDAVARARALPQLGVGLHVVLVEGRPMLPPEQIPALVGPDGWFRTDMVRMAVQIFASPSARAQLAAEVEAQFAAFTATGLTLDHVNAHKHFHLHPTIAGTILRVGRRHGMKAIRAPIEPRAVINAIDGSRLGPRIETLWAKRVARGMRRAGQAVPDAVFGLAWSGAMTPARMRGLVEHLPDGLTEIYTHPATQAYPGSAPGYDYAGELAALTDAAVAGLIASRGIALGCFGDFA
jgi:chitin disaccharide deacetylase